MRRKEKVNHNIPRNKDGQRESPPPQPTKVSREVWAMKMVQESEETKK